jgi:hypothetical protein
MGRWTSGEQFMDSACGETKRDRANRTAKTDDASPEQRELKIARLRPFPEPHPKLQPTQRKEDSAPPLRICAAIWHSNQLIADGKKIKIVLQR